MKHAPYQTKQIEMAITCMKDYAKDTSLSYAQREANIHEKAMKAIAMILANADHFINEMEGDTLSCGNTL